MDLCRSRRKVTTVPNTLLQLQTFGCVSSASSFPLSGHETGQATLFFDDKIHINIWESQRSLNFNAEEQPWHALTVTYNHLSAEGLTVWAPGRLISKDFHPWLLTWRTGRSDLVATASPRGHGPKWVGRTGGKRFWRRFRRRSTARRIHVQHGIPRHSMGLPYMPTLTSNHPNVGIYMA